jgi:hypothetical protein
MNPQAPSKNDWVTTASIAVFILLAIGIVSFLYYQNQELKKLVANYQNASPTPTSTPVVMIEIASPSASPMKNKTSIPTAKPIVLPSLNPSNY